MSSNNISGFAYIPIKKIRSLTDHYLHPIEAQHKLDVIYSPDMNLISLKYFAIGE
jgi:hypothetical protein